MLIKQYIRKNHIFYIYIFKEVGTDIYLQNLFRNLPVRYQEFKANYKSQFTSAVSLLENYALISTEAKITVINSTADKPYFKMRSMFIILTIKMGSNSFKQRAQYASKR